MVPVDGEFFSIGDVCLTVQSFVVAFSAAQNPLPAWLRAEMPRARNVFIWNLAQFTLQIRITFRNSYRRCSTCIWWYGDGMTDIHNLKNAHLRYVASFMHWNNWSTSFVYCPLNVYVIFSD